MKKVFTWKWLEGEEIYVHHNTPFLILILFVYSWFNPVSFGHWIGTIAHAVKDVL